MCSCSRPRAKCLSNYFAQLSAGRACVFILSHCRNNNNNNRRSRRSWRRTTAASLTVCLCLSNCSRQATTTATSRQGMPATWRDTPATSTAASPSSVNNRVEQKKRKPLRKLMWQTCKCCHAHRPTDAAQCCRPPSLSACAAYQRSLSSSCTSVLLLTVLSSIFPPLLLLSYSLSFFLCLPFSSLLLFPHSFCTFFLPFLLDSCTPCCLLRSAL